MLLLTCAYAGHGTDDLGLRLARFHTHYDPFMRKYFGCPTGAHELTECNPHMSAIDYREFREACRAAVRLFELPLDSGACSR